MVFNFLSDHEKALVKAKQYEQNGVDDRINKQYVRVQSEGRFGWIIGGAIIALLGLAGSAKAKDQNASKLPEDAIENISTTVKPGEVDTALAAGNKIKIGGQEFAPGEQRGGRARN